MVRQVAHAPSHTMELPRKIEIGENTLGRLGDFVKSLGISHRVSLVSGSHVKRMIRREIDSSLERSGMRALWHVAPDNDVRSFERLANTVQDDSPEAIIGAGGGRAVDAAKFAAFKIDAPFISVPTAASHDGIASPFVSMWGKEPYSVKPYSVVSNAPLGVFVDTMIIRRAPAQLLASGCGDLIANIVAVRDWELGNQTTGEYYGVYAANLARMSAEMVIRNAPKLAGGDADVRTVVEALISAGVAACIAGSSRPCSGAEHLFSHALDKIAPGRGLHGEKCGIGAIMMAKLQRQDWRAIRRALTRVGAPTSAAEVGLTEDNVVDALIKAQSLRPDRYTILERVKMTKRKARNLARSVHVI